MRDICHILVTLALLTLVSCGGGSGDSASDAVHSENDPAVTDNTNNQNTDPINPVFREPEVFAGQLIEIAVPGIDSNSFPAVGFRFSDASGNNGMDSSPP